MKTYLTDLIPRIRRYGEKLDNLTLLTNQSWVMIDELVNTKFVYIFRSNNDLLISKNGRVEKGRWEYLGNNSLLVEQKDGSFLFRHGFFDENILALKVDGKDEFAFLVNENNYGGDLNSVDKVLDFLESKYVKMHSGIERDSYSPPLTASIKKFQSSSTNDLKYRALDKELNIVWNSENKHGFMDINGNLVIRCKYDRAYDFSEGLALVYITVNGNDIYGYIDKKGNEIISPQFEYAESFSNGLALIRDNRRFGYIDNKGDIKIDFVFDEAESFSHGRAKVRIGDRRFTIDTNGFEV